MSLFTTKQMEMTEEAKPCSNPGCDQPGTKSCSACKTTVYCCVSCQTADWSSHKEECDGHMRKLGVANLDKAKVFNRQRNWMQTLRYAEVATTKLKKLKDRRLETVVVINDALMTKYNAILWIVIGRLWSVPKKDIHYGP